MVAVSALALVLVTADRHPCPWPRPAALGFLVW